MKSFKVELTETEAFHLTQMLDRDCKSLVTGAEDQPDNDLAVKRYETALRLRAKFTISGVDNYGVDHV